MPTVNPSSLGGPKPQFELSDGTPATGYKLFFYVAGSVNTKQDTYTDSTGTVANTNPVVLNSLGNPTTEIWFTAGLSYKAVLAPSTDTDPPTSPVWTVDNLRGINDSSVSIDQWVASGVTPTYVSATSFTLPGDQTSAFHIGRRIKSTNTSGTIYSRITNSVFGALTTVTVVNDSGSLDTGLSSVSLGLLTATNPSFPAIIDGGSGVTVTYPAGRPTIAVTNTLNTTSPRLLENIGVSVTMAGNAVTIALKGSDGNDPSASNLVGIGFRNSTVTNGQASKVQVSAAMSVTISSGSTLGTVSGDASRVWIAAINNGGTVELAVFQSRGSQTVNAINEGALISTTAEGGAGAADSAGTWYSTTSRSNVPFTIIAYFDSTQATAGTWASSASAVVTNPEPRPLANLIEGTALVKNPLALNTTTTQAHGLGQVPDFLRCRMECLSSDGNWAVGDIICFGGSHYDQSDATTRGWLVNADKTNVELVVGQTSVGALNKSTRAYLAIDVTKWKMTVTPYLILA